MVNLFWLQPPTIVHGRLNYVACAAQHLDAHIIKIPLEAAQLLYNAHHRYPTSTDWQSAAPLTLSGANGYKPVHKNNPISKWVSGSLIHYRHTWAYALALCQEYTHRYGKEHKCETHVRWLSEHEPAIPHPEIPDRSIDVVGFSVVVDPPLAMPDEYKITVETYKEGSFPGHVDPAYTFSPCIYQSYQNYYIGAKMGLRMTSWKLRDIPEWAKIAYEKKRADMLAEKAQVTETRKKTRKTRTRTRKVKKEEEEKEKEDEEEEVTVEVKKSTRQLRVKKERKNEEEDDDIVFGVKKRKRVTRRKVDDEEEEEKEETKEETVAIHTRRKRKKVETNKTEKKKKAKAILASKE